MSADPAWSATGPFDGLIASGEHEIAVCMGVGEMCRSSRYPGEGWPVTGDALNRDVDEPSFVDFVAARSSSLQRAAWLLTGDRHQAEDLVQATLATVWRRRSWHERPTGEVADRHSGVDIAAEAADRTALSAALAVLPPRQRAVVVLRYYDDLTIEQAADVLGVSASSVTTHVSRALITLRACGLLEGMEGAHHG